MILDPTPNRGSRSRKSVFSGAWSWAVKWPRNARIPLGHRFPSSQLDVVGTQPCPCGHHGDRRHECYCSPLQVENYRRRLSSSAQTLLDGAGRVQMARLSRARPPDWALQGPASQKSQSPV
ncbi:MAG: hypothetical protein GY769_02125 [bacterium]|nr:hypothetical protein [bacterium]